MKKNDDKEEKITLKGTFLAHNILFFVQMQFSYVDNCQKMAWISFIVLYTFCYHKNKIFLNKYTNLYYWLFLKLVRLSNNLCEALLEKDTYAMILLI